MLVPSLHVYAYQAGQVQQGSSGGSGNSSNTEDTDPYQAYTTYTPKVTLLRNANALCANSGEAIYYIPTLDDLPLDLEAYVTDCTDGTYSHKFAYVYSSYFNSDAQLVTISSDSTTAEAHTSQNIETAYIANSTLKDVGYDLLLLSDSYSMKTTSGTSAEISNLHEAANDTNLQAKYVVMDLYKALGIYEYDIQFCFTRDPDFDANSSPILQEITVLTSQSGSNGLNIKESRTDVAVSRTNSELYWIRFDKDGIARKLENNTEIEGSQITGLATSISAESTITFAQFCNLAVAMMNLYGEEALTDTQYSACIQSYGTDITAIQTNSKIEETSAIYLIAKGILDGDSLQDIAWDEPVRLLNVSGNTYTNSNYILDILGRIANPDRRLTLKSSTPIDATLAAAGYSEATVTINSMISNVITFSTDSSFLYDYLIEVVPENTHICRYNSATTSLNSTSESLLATTSTSSPQGTASSSEYNAFANMRVFVNGIAYDPKNTIDDCLQSGGYVYYGVITVDGKQYYHFKMKKFWEDGATVYFDYQPSNTEEIVTDASPIRLESMSGGVYSYSSGNYIRQSFTEANFVESYIDAESSVSTQLASGNTTLLFYMSSAVNKEILSLYNDSTFTWTNIFDSNNLRYGEPVTICNRSDNVTIMTVFSGTSVNGDYDRCEIITNNLSAVQNSSFYTNYLGSNSEKRTAKGFYRASSNGSLMVEYDYLKEQGLVSGFKEVSDGTYVITAGKYKTNVTILTKNDLIIVGDTIYSNTGGEVLVLKTNGTTYINYRCCLGWAGDFAVIPTGDTIVATPIQLFGSTTSITQTTKSISTFYPSANTKLLYNTLVYHENASDEKDYAGFSLSGSYALAPYILVSTDDDYDYLFVWHRNNIVSTDGNTVYNISVEDNDAAFNKFKELTGVKLNSQNNYSLAMFPLNKNGVGNPAGFEYTKLEQSSARGTKSATAGWVYTPPVFNDVLSALNTYASVSSDLAIPIFARTVGNVTHYFDANVNVCAESAGNDYLPLGTMPSYLTTANKDTYYSKLTSSGSYSTTTAAGESTKAYPIYTAPVGLFAQLKGMGTTAAKDIGQGSIYFGTTKCTLSNGSITISGRATTFDSSSEAVCTYMSNGSSSVYAVTLESTTLGDILTAIDQELEYTLNDPENLVDWSQYKFERLIQNLDAWSTVVLIFVLNILPRVAVLLFFILMLLSLMKDWKPFQMFCHRWFDPFKFLTLGHISVDNVNLKRLLIISLICISLMMVIMDGQLFNFIIWIAKALVAITQR
jgi:hypothetical protein